MHSVYRYMHPQFVYPSFHRSQHDTRFFPFFPFVLGGLAGLAVAPFFYRPYYPPYPYPPVYPPAYPAYGPYYGGVGGYPVQETINIYS
ncbi:hypothetical protein [Bacillus litorisediminis]|uniref:hypothetical protein n=1 Tax=Bacillus litorisediminis TaxID=2922713 RepID=UPI001FAFEBF2|nr:hypothetical protein [Bacillus litorisediminis]